MKINAFIPVRMSSSRFPGKPLTKLLDITMLEHVWRRTKMSACRPASQPANPASQQKTIAQATFQKRHNFFHRVIANRNPARKPASKLAFKQASKPISRPGGKSGGKPARKTASKLASKPASKPGDKTIDKPYIRFLFKATPDSPLCGHYLY